MECQGQLNKYAAWIAEDEVVLVPGQLGLRKVSFRDAGHEELTILDVANVMIPSQNRLRAKGLQATSEQCDGKTFSM